MYTNITLGTNQPAAVMNSLQGRNAYLTPARSGVVIVYDEACDAQVLEELRGLGKALSKKHQCAAWAVLNHDDDVLYYLLFDAGAQVDEYNSCPNYFDAAASSKPSGGNAEKLCQAFGSKSVLDVARILKSTDRSDDAYLFEFARHGQLCEVLGIPEYGVGMGYNYLHRGEVPDGLEKSDLMHTQAPSKGVVVPFRFR